MISNISLRQVLYERKKLLTHANVGIVELLLEERVVNCASLRSWTLVLTQVPEWISLQLLHHQLKVKLIPEDSVSSAHQPKQSIGAVIRLVELLVDPLLIETRNILVARCVALDHRVEFLSHVRVSQDTNERTVDVVDHNKGQITQHWISEELALGIGFRPKETKEKHRVGNLVAQNTFFFVNISLSLRY